MQQMGGLDYAVEVEEMQPLVGSRFKKFYACEDKTLRLKLHKKGDVNIVAENGVRLHIAEKFAESLEKPSQFSMVVRKHLENAPLTAVSQLAGDRIIEFTFGKIKLVFELFAKGNCILVGEDGKIIDVMKREAYASRKIAPKHPYVAPPSEKKPIAQVEETDLQGSGNLTALLSNKLSTSTIYIEEAIARCGVKKEGAELTPQEKNSIIFELRKISVDRKPMVYYENGKPAAFAVTELKQFEHSEKKQFEKFSQALEEYYINVDRTSAENKKHGKGKKAEGREEIMEKLKRKLKFQLESETEFREKERRAQETGDYIYANHQLFENLLAAARKLKEEKRKPEEIETELNKISVEHGQKLKIKIGEKGEIEVEVNG